MDGTKRRAFRDNPDGVPEKIRRRMPDATGELNRMEMEKIADPEIQVRIAQYEMAFACRHRCRS
jgi:hypothetical protein